MTVDHTVHAFAASWLQAGGWTHTGDVMKLACVVQEVCEEFTNALEQQYEHEAEHGRNQFR